MVLIGVGAGAAFPALMTLAMSGAHARATRAWRPAWSTRRRRSAARSAWPCWPRSRRRAPRRCCDGGDTTAAALTGGYRLAFVVACALVIAAIAVALVVLEPARRAGGARVHAAEPEPEPVEVG